MSSARYERLPATPDLPLPSPDARTPTSFDLDDEEMNIGRRSPNANRVVFAHDPRFDVPTPPAWQRAALLIFVVFLFWLGFRLNKRQVEVGVPAFVE